MTAGRERKLIIIRHGNTFENEPSRRIGAATDIPLVKKGREQAAAAAAYLREQGIRPDRVFAAPLKRTSETAGIIARDMGLDCPILPAGEFVEIDYGPDENKTDKDVAENLGRRILSKSGGADITPEQATEAGNAAIRDWDTNGTVPDGWKVDVEKIIGDWRTFAAGVRLCETVLLASSNGIIRFSPHLLAEGYESFYRRQGIKVSPGNVCVFRDKGAGWECAFWNVKP